MMSPPFVSVVVPVYKVEELLDKCVGSILNQSFCDFELILVDDGSPDRCSQMCDEYQKKDNRVKVIHKENGGANSARKAGTAIASGKYILVVDSDDWIDRNLLQHIYDAIEESDSDAICYNYYQVKKETKKVMHKYAEGMYVGERLDEVRRAYLYDPQKRGLNGGALPTTMWSKVVRRSLFSTCLQLVPDDVRKGEDSLFVLNLLERCHSVYMLDYAGYFYRLNPSSITHVYSYADLVELHRLAEYMLAMETEDRQTHMNKVCVCTFCSFWFLLVGLAKQTKTMVEFVTSINGVYHSDFDKYFSNIRLTKFTLIDKVKLTMVRKHMWRMIYLVENR